MHAPPNVDIAHTNALRNACPICHGQVHSIFEIFDDRYGFPGQRSLWCCASCGHRALNAGMDAREISDLYTHYYPRSGFDVEAWTPPTSESASRSWWQGLNASAFRWVPPDVRVLDIGCGFGESLGYHRARGCDAHGVEADANILRVANRHGLNVRHGLFDADNYAPEFFDVVTMDQVIEHVTCPVEVLRGIRQVLKPAGMLIITTPNAGGWGARVFGSKWIHWHAPYHQQFFSRQSMQEAARASGFSLERQRTLTNSAWLGFQWCHLLSYPKPGERSAFWSPLVQRTIGQRWGFRLLSVLDRLGINSLLTRIADIAGYGDNVVFVLRKVSNA